MSGRVLSSDSANSQSAILAGKPPYEINSCHDKWHSNADLLQALQDCTNVEWDKKRAVECIKVETNANGDENTEESTENCMVFGGV